MHEGHAELTGTFLGHIAPGVILTVWGLWWLWSVSRHLEGLAPLASSQGPAGRGAWPVRTSFSVHESWAKILVALGAAIGDLWWASWRLTDTSVMNYQHATAYLGLALAGASDLLARRGKLPSYVPQLLLAGALVHAGFQFYAHGNHLPVSDSVHRLVIAVFVLQAGATLLELAYRHPAFSVVRAYAMLLQGAWFFQIAWMLYRSGWDLSNAYHVMRVYLFFTWHLMGVLVATWALVGLLRRWAAAGARSRTPLAEGARGVA